MGSGAPVPYAAVFEIGNSLKEARLRRRLDVVDAEHDTKIRKKYLMALETEDFTVLPGPVYTKGFLRTYATYLGLDSQLYLDEYNARFGRYEDLEEAVVARNNLAENVSHRGVPSIRFLAIVSLVTLVSLGWLGWRDDTDPVERERGQAAAPQAAKDVDETVHAPVHAKAPVEPTLPTSVQLTVTARGGASWISVRRGANARGPVLFEGTVAQGSRKRFAPKGAKRLFITVGYPSATVLSVPGSKLSPKSADTLQFVVTPTNIRTA